MGLTVADSDWKYLKLDRDRHGNLRTYVRRFDRKIRLHEKRGTPEFAIEYASAVKRLSPGLPSAASARSPFPPHTLGWLGIQYFASNEFQALDATSQSNRRGILEACFQEPLSDDDPEHMGFCPLNKLATKHIKRLRDLKKGLPGAANNRRKYLSAMFGWAIEEAKPQLMTTNVARDVRRVKYAKKGFHTWTPGEVAKFEERHPVGTKARLALGLLLFTGTRRGDMVKLGRQHVKDDWLRFVPRKTLYKRQEISEKPWLSVLADLVAKSPCGNLTFLTTEYGRPFTAAGFGNWFRDRCNEATLPHCAAHGLRKAGATLAAENGATTKQLMVMFDWSTPGQAEVYIEAANKKRLAREAMPLLATGRT